MKKIVNLAPVAVLALIAGLSVGCSPTAKRDRHLERADRFHDAGRYESAEIEYLSARKLDPKNARAILRLGLIYYEQGRVALSRAYLQRARENDPQSLDVRLRLGYIHLALNQAREAYGEATFILEMNPRHPEAPLLLAETVRTNEEIEQVRERLEKISAKVGETAPIQLALATLRFREGDVAAAEAACLRALALDPKSAAAHFFMGNLHLALNHLEQADAAFKAAADLSPVRSLRRMKYVEFKIQTGNVPEAKSLLNEMTTEARDFLPAWIRLADMALSEKDYKAAAAMLKKALAQDPANYEALLLSGNLRLAESDAAGAIEVFNRVLSLYERSPHAHFKIAAAHLLKDDLPTAIRSLNQAVALAPDFEDAILLLARLQFKRGEHASTVSSLRQLAARKPRDVQVHVLLAEAYRAMGKLDDAVEVCSRIEQALPQDPTPPLLRGAILTQQNKRTEARKAYERVLILTPGFLPALEQLMELDLAEGNNAQALDRVRTELGARPDVPQLHYLLSKIFLAQRDGTSSVAALLKAIELDPGYVAAHLMLARVYVEAREYTKALESLGPVLDRDPKDATALMMTGMIQTELKNFPAARSAYELLVAVDSNQGMALNNLAHLYSEEFGMLDQAHDAARKAVQLLPASPHASDTLGWILFKRGDYQRAAGLLSESAKALPNAPDTHFRLGMTYYMLADESRAERMLKNALAMKKDFRGKDEAERRLAILDIDGRAADADAVQLLEQHLAKQPGDPVALARLVTRYESQREPKLAIAALESAVKASPGNVSALTRLAWLYRRLGNSSKAIEKAKEAYRLTSDDPEVAYILGLQTFEARDHRRAVTLLEQTVRAPNSDAERHYDLGVAYYSVGRITDAQSAVNKALSQGTAFSRADEARQFLRLVELSASSTVAEQSASAVGPILSANPDNVPARLVLARAAEQRKEIQAARAEYERVLRIYPEFSPAKKSLVALYLEAPSDDAKAYEMAQQARLAFPDDPELARGLGIALFRRGDFRGSITYLEQSLRKTNDGQTMFHLGMAYRELKDKEKARAALQKALQLDISTASAEAATKALAELE